jgi:hypothetical protein
MRRERPFRSALWPAPGGKAAPHGAAVFKISIVGEAARMRVSVMAKLYRWQLKSTRTTARLP